MLKRTESSGLICPKTTVAGPAFMAQWALALGFVLSIPSLLQGKHSSACPDKQGSIPPKSLHTQHIPSASPKSPSVFPLSILLIWLHGIFHSTEDAVSTLRNKVIKCGKWAAHCLYHPFVSLMVLSASRPQIYYYVSVAPPCPYHGHDSLSLVRA